MWILPEVQLGRFFKTTLSDIKKYTTINSDFSNLKVAESRFESQV